MPFESKAQQRFMYSQHPDIAKRWAKITNFKSLPEKVGKNGPKNPYMTAVHRAK